MVREGFKPLTIIASLVDSAIGAAPQGATDKSYPDVMMVALAVGSCVRLCVKST
jgi:hypothetical protein